MLTDGGVARMGLGVCLAPGYRRGSTVTRIALGVFGNRADIPSRSRIVSTRAAPIPESRPAALRGIRDGVCGWTAMLLLLGEPDAARSPGV
uniref:Uncharacterized protein n=1 Tax=Candidatus Kentrum eta TaxID=2126337 RepID=A0A450UF39_9GAMM|nr:MAG: hypothetical protein BECKH772A_GA0070896_1001437 [Candidatus Kentron sp. H]VFJ91160.1 MAG: hypothetical protein BECKH772B_GA0070898_1001437 [Candidatus Kentron sp. H]VFJ97506.1 MAG: hypothetical protein BECKH772C_GA0070978_1001337 [Candidatus Kentron sp. H]